MYKWIILFLMIPAIVLGQSFENNSYDKLNATSSGWGDISQAPFKIRGHDDSVIVSINPLDYQNDTYPIILRVGERAVRSGDSRTLIYASDSISTAGATESQAIYGINQYSGKSTAGQLGVHGIAQLLMATNDTITIGVGVQGFGQFRGTGGHATNMFGGSFTAKSDAGATGTAGAFVGVRGDAFNAGDGTVSQANAFRGIAATNTGGGSITWARTAYFEQPKEGASENYALMLADPSTGSGDDNIVMAFRDSAASNREFMFHQRRTLFQFDWKVGILQDTDGLSSRLYLLHGDTTGVGTSNALIHFTQDDSLDAAAANQWTIGQRWGDGFNDFEFLKANDVIFELWPDSAILEKDTYLYTVNPESLIMTKGYIDGVASGDNVWADTAGDGTNVVNVASPVILQQGTNIELTVINGDTVNIAGPAGSGSADTVYVHTDADDDSISSVNNRISIKSGVGLDVTITGDTATTVVDETEFNAMYNNGDTVTGTYNFGDNPLEAITIIDFDDDMSAPAHQEARIFYDPTDNTLCYYNNEADVTMNLGQEGWVYARNITGSTILDGKIVYITGAVSSRPTIALAQADAEATSKLIGVATHDIETASNGYVTVWGVVRGINLSDFSDGDEVFLSAAVAGSLTATAPSAPNYVVEVGYVIDASANGDLLVSTGKSKMLNSLGDVLISGPTEGDILFYNGTVWADTTGIYLPLAGGTMEGNIVMDNYDITGADYISSDSIVIGEDTLYNEHIIAYLTRLRVRNASGAALSAGTPVYISGITGNRPNVDSARADNAALMPAVGLIEHDINNNADGFVVISGEFGPYNTVAWSVQDPLYVGATGGLTTTKPTGTNLIQKMGIVTRDNATVGTIQLVGAGRTNDLPNVASANFWLGNGSAVPTAVTMSGDATMDNAGALDVTFSDSVDMGLVPTWTGTHTFTGTHDIQSTAFTADSAQFDGNVDIDSLDINGVADFVGPVNMSGVTIIDGASSSLEIPNGSNPTTNAEGEIAWDSDDDALEVYMGDEGESALIPGYKKFGGTISVPDSIQAQSDSLPLWHANGIMFPFGVEIDLVSITLEADAAYSVVLQEWSSADPPVYQNVITTIATGASDSYAEEAPDTDGNLDINDRVYLVLPTTDVPSVMIEVYYHVTEGD